MTFVELSEVPRNYKLIVILRDSDRFPAETLRRRGEEK